MECFRSEKISEHITAIRGITNEIMYLIQGEEKACLVDTGIGYGDLREYVRTLTKQPVTVLLTHGHLDHTGGCALFDNVYLHKADVELFKQSYSKKEALNYIRLVLGREKAASIDESLLPDSLPADLQFYEGYQEFDLGGIVLKIIDCPGHTRGSVSVLVQEERKLILGDACNHATYLFFKESLSVGEYKNSLLKLKKYEEQWDEVLFSHYSIRGDKSVVDQVLNVCQRVLDGKADNIPYEFMGEKGYVAVKVKDFIKYERYDNQIGNVIYKKV